MTYLLHAGLLCYALALVLPSYDDNGPFKIHGPGWKMFALSFLLFGLGLVALTKDTNDRIWPYFIPGAINLGFIALALAGLFSFSGPWLTMLAAGQLLLHGLCLFFLYFKTRGSLKIGTHLWCAANVLVAAHAIGM